VSDSSGALPRKGAVSRSGRNRIALVLLVVPLVAFILLLFVWPVLRFLALAVDNSDVAENLPRTAAAISSWDAQAGELPDDAVFRALVDDLADARAAGRDGVLAQLINQREVGTRFLVIRTAQAAAAGELAAEPARATLLAAFPGWDNPRLWRVLARDSSPLTANYLLASLDLTRTPEGAVVPVPADQAIFVSLLLRTVWISLVVTGICAVLALPLAQAIVSAPKSWSRVMFALVLFPLWTSLLVRTVIWIIMLQKNGPVNAALVAFGLAPEPLSLIYTRFSLYVTMVQVLLPLMVLSIVSVMRRISPNYMKAALSLGAPWLVAWVRVQLPLILPGVLAGSAIVFVFALGYYITPELVGGPGERMISSYIAFFTNETLNWGMGAALSLQLIGILVGAAIAFRLAAILFRRRPA
jgi:putative spermidine/putrescine transport system permease protein